MANMRDKITALKGKKLDVQECEGIRITLPRATTWHYKIIEVGEDYFVVKFVATSKDICDPDRSPTIYAISAVTKIDGGI